MTNPNSSRSMKIVEERCSRFEDEWKELVVRGENSSKNRPDIEKYLDGTTDVERTNLLIELVRLDLHYRRLHGDEASLLDYEARFPTNINLLQMTLGHPGILAGETVAGDATQDTVKIPTLIPGQTVGKYVVKETLKSGAFGSVYKAYDSQLQRYVCIKTLKKEGQLQQDAIDEFLNEARTLARLNKQDVFIPVYDSGFEQNTPFLVMELVDTGSLADVLNEGRLDFDKSVEIVSTLSAGIELAHKAGVIHRDLKPANILIDEDGNPRIADFGLAIYENDRWNRLGEFAGTLNYMSPEQVSGKINLVDARTDIWALGVILYEMATGQLPFDASNVDEIKKGILEEDPRAPSSINPDLSPELEATILKALSKARHHRYESANDFAEALLKLLIDKNGDADGTSDSRSKAVLPILLGCVSLIVATFALLFNYSSSVNVSSKLEAREFVAQLFESDVTEVPEIIAQQLPLSADAKLILHEEVGKAGNSSLKRRASLALSHTETNQIPFLYESLFDGIQPKEFEVLSNSLDEIDNSFVERLQGELAMFGRKNESYVGISEVNKGQIEEADGVVTDEFAFCQTMDQDLFLQIQKNMADAGYSLDQARPFRWKEHVHNDGFHAEDISAYRDDDGEIKYCCLWRLAEPDKEVGVYCDSAELQLLMSLNPDLRVRSKFNYESNDGVQQHCGAWVKSGDHGKIPLALKTDFEVTPTYFDSFPYFQENIQVRRSAMQDHFQENWLQQNKLISQLIGTESEDASALSMKARCSFYVQDMDASIEFSTKAIELSPTNFSAYTYRALANAWKGNAKQAKLDLRKYKDGALRAKSKQFKRPAYDMWLESSIDFYLGRDRAATDRLAAELSKHDHRAEYCIYGACAYAAGAEAARFRGEIESTSDRITAAIELLDQTVENGYTYVERFRYVPELAILQSDPRFIQILKGNSTLKVYSGNWRGGDQNQSTTSYGLRPDLHRRHAVMLAAQGFVPSSVSVCEIDENDHLATASTWSKQSDRSVVRTCKAFLALFLVEKVKDKSWQLFETNDCRPERVFTNLVSAYDLDVERFFKCYKQQEDPAIRRQIFNFIGTCSRGSIPTDTPPQLISHLSEGVKDSNSGVQSSAIWLAEKLGKHDLRDFAHSMPSNGRQWFHNSQRQKLVVFPPNTQFWVHQFDRPRRSKFYYYSTAKLDYSFAAGAREVSVAQFRKFQVEFDPSAAAESPATKLSFFDAAKYCNWLSREEGLDEFYRLDESGSQLKVSFPSLEDHDGYRMLTTLEWAMVLEDGALWASPNSEDIAFAREGVPDRNGVFDNYCSVDEWTSNATASVTFDRKGDRVLFRRIPIKENTLVSLRGGAVKNSSSRAEANSLEKSPKVGFRIGRTVTTAN